MVLKSSISMSMGVKMSMARRRLDAASSLMVAALSLSVLSTQLLVRLVGDRLLLVSRMASAFESRHSLIWQLSSLSIVYTVKILVPSRMQVG